MSLSLETRKRVRADLLLRAERSEVAILPTYNNTWTVSRVARGLLELVPQVIVVDDGSDAQTKAVLAELGKTEGIEILTREENGGKGAAVKSGLARAVERGFTHAIQVDADEQHDLNSAPSLLEASRNAPLALVLGHPVFDESAPTSRRIGRNISVFWTHAATVLDPGRIQDPMCGFRVYPVEAAHEASRHTGDRMDFDPEVAIRLAWQGREVVNLPVNVRYPEGGISHYRAFADNVLVAVMHARLCIYRYLGFYRWM